MIRSNYTVNFKKIDQKTIDFDIMQRRAPKMAVYNMSVMLFLVFYDMTEVYVYFCAACMSHSQINHILLSQTL